MSDLINKTTDIAVVDMIETISKIVKGKQEEHCTVKNIELMELCRALVNGEEETVLAANLDAWGLTIIGESWAEVVIHFTDEDELTYSQTVFSSSDSEIIHALSNSTLNVCRHLMDKTSVAILDNLQSFEITDESIHELFNRIYEDSGDLITQAIVRPGNRIELKGEVASVNLNVLCHYDTAHFKFTRAIEEHQVVNTAREIMTGGYVTINFTNNCSPEELANELIANNGYRVLPSYEPNKIRLLKGTEIIVHLTEGKVALLASLSSSDTSVSIEAENIVKASKALHSPGIVKAITQDKGYFTLEESEAEPAPSEEVVSKLRSYRMDSLTAEVVTELLHNELGDEWQSKHNFLSIGVIVDGKLVTAYNGNDESAKFVLLSNKVAEVPELNDSIVRGTELCYLDPEGTKFVAGEFNSSDFSRLLKYIDFNINSDDTDHT